MKAETPNWYCRNHSRLKTSSIVTIWAFPCLPCGEFSVIFRELWKALSLKALETCSNSYWTPKAPIVSAWFGQLCGAANQGGEISSLLIRSRIAASNRISTSASASCESNRFGCVSHSPMHDYLTFSGMFRLSCRAYVSVSWVTSELRSVVNTWRTSFQRQHAAIGQTIRTRATC